ncbi:MAG TPA: dienelactone hydrolase family protein [Mucilaginibacter sp.]|nr:dienelactone hydrolase family protein [Mucilaginibacter sp.]
MRSFLLFFFTTICVQALAQQKNETIMVDGLKREFVTYIPQGIKFSDKSPVIISLHGRLGTASGQMRFADFRPIADKEKFIIVCPQGINRSWNDGRGTPANAKGINDVKFIDNLITYILKTYNGDSTKVYVTGMSNGGFMSSRLACELNKRIAAIAVVGASMDKDETYRPTIPMPVMYIQGTQDPLVPFAGGTMKKGAGGIIYGHEEVLKEWAAVDGCDKNPAVTTLTVIVNDGTSVIKEVYSNPSNNLKVIGYTVVNGGHTWPGGSQYMPRFAIGSVTKNLNACDVIWQFFKGNRLSASN